MEVKSPICVFSLKNSFQTHPDFGYFNAFATDNDAFAGLGTLLMNEDSDEAEIEYLLLPSYWGKGYGTEIVGCLLERICETGAKRVVAITDPSNVASRKILLKTGFVSEEIYQIDDGQ